MEHQETTPGFSPRLEAYIIHTGDVTIKEILMSKQTLYNTQEHFLSQNVPRKRLDRCLGLCEPIQEDPVEMDTKEWQQMSYRTLLSAVIGSLAIGAYAAPPGEPPFTHPPSTADWEDLFAPDLSNAVFPAGVWSFANGELTATEDQAIWTKEDYEDFLLDLEFKTSPAANSGVFVYCTDIDKWVTSCIEVQILDDYAEKWATVDATWKCGGIFGRLAPAKQVVKPAGEWNRYTIRCVGKMVNVVLNGEDILTMNMHDWKEVGRNPDGSAAPEWLGGPLCNMATKGRIGLQGKHAGAPIWFRNMKVMKLTPIEPVKTKRAAIFNGANLDGWTLLQCDAKVDDGDILIQGGNGLLQTEKMYGDFVLEFEWKPLAEDKWDSGVYFRYDSKPDKEAWPERYQVNLRKGKEGNVEGLEGAASTGLVVPDAWNAFRLVVKGDSAELKINDQQAWKARGLQGPAKGYIALQAEVPGGGQHRFRKIYVTEIEPIPGKD